ncbi:MAG: hypothetical protein ABMA15_04245 [Vicinamibacterales bacterium]
MSRHIGLPFVGPAHQSATPAPPMYARLPSTTSNSRCVRMLMRLSRYQVIVWYGSTRQPAVRSSPAACRNAPKLPIASITRPDPQRTDGK